MPSHPASPIFTNLPPRKRLSRPKLELEKGKKEDEDNEDEKGADCSRMGPIRTSQNWLEIGRRRTQKLWWETLAEEERAKERTFASFFEKKRIKGKVGKSNVKERRWGGRKKNVARIHKTRRIRG